MTRPRGGKKGGRLGYLIRKTARSTQWCREFLRDFGIFNDKAARSLGTRVREMDLGMAKAVIGQERQEEDEDFRRRNTKAVDCDVPVTEIRNRNVTEADLTKIFG